jgi:UrcA family protein
MVLMVEVIMVGGKLMAAVMAGAVMMAAVPAMAQQEKPLQQNITVADLDLASRDGLRRAEYRIRAAVAKACPTLQARELRGLTSAKQCRQQASLAALQQLRLHASSAQLAMARNIGRGAE